MMRRLMSLDQVRQILWQLLSARILLMRGRNHLCARSLCQTAWNLTCQDSPAFIFLSLAWLARFTIRRAFLAHLQWPITISLIIKYHYSTHTNFNSCCASLSEAGASEWVRSNCMHPLSMKQFDKCKLVCQTGMYFRGQSWQTPILPYYVLQMMV